MNDPFVIENLLEVRKRLSRDDDELDELDLYIRHCFNIAVSILMEYHTENDLLNRLLAERRRSAAQNYDEAGQGEIERLRRENAQLIQNDKMRQIKIEHLAATLKRAQPWRNYITASASVIKYGNIRSAGGGPSQENAVRALEDAPQALEEGRATQVEDSEL